LLLLASHPTTQIFWGLSPPLVGNPKPTLRSFLDDRGVLPPVARLTRVFDRLIAASAPSPLGLVGHAVVR
jgi:hypothetical protein